MLFIYTTAKILLEFSVLSLRPISSGHALLVTAKCPLPTPQPKYSSSFLSSARSHHLRLLCMGHVLSLIFCGICILWIWYHRYAKTTATYITTKILFEFSVPTNVQSTPAMSGGAFVVIGTLKHWYLVNLVSQIPRKMSPTYTTYNILFEFCVSSQRPVNSGHFL